LIYIYIYIYIKGGFIFDFFFFVTCCGCCGKCCNELGYKYCRYLNPDICSSCFSAFFRCFFFCLRCYKFGASCDSNFFSCKCFVCKKQCINYLTCSEGHTNCVDCFKKLVEKMDNKIELKKTEFRCCVKRCDGIYNKNEYSKLLSLSKLSKIYEIDDYNRIKYVCFNRKNYCNRCRKLTDNNNIIQCKTCRKYFCTEHNYSSCPDCRVKFN
jgi:hypothetical protein